MLASTWVDTGPPASPSEEDIDNYRKLLLEALGTKKAGRIMLLGCTPKLRDMLRESFTAYDVTCVDFSEMMYKRTTELVKHPNPRESFVLSDWLTLDIGRHEFDAALGDKVIDNVMPEDWLTFFGTIHVHLCPRGYFVAHLAPQNMTFKYLTFSSSLHKWADYHRRHGEPLEQVVSALWEEMLGASAFKDGKRCPTQRIRRFSSEIDRIQANIGALDEVERAIFNEFIRIFWNNKDDEWSSYEYEEILDVMSHYFVHEKTVHSGDYHVASVQPIVRMKARLESEI